MRPGGVFFGVAPDADNILQTLGDSEEVTIQPPEVPFVLRIKRLRDAAGGGGGMQGGIEEGDCGGGNGGKGDDAKGAGGGSGTNAAGAVDASGDEHRSEFRCESGSEFGRRLYFSLENTVTQDSDRQGDAHEFLIERSTLVRLASAQGLRPILLESMLHPSAGGGGKRGRGGSEDGGLPCLSAAEASVARLYFSFAFRKEGRGTKERSWG